MGPKRRHRRHIGPPGKPTSQILAPHASWSAEVQGHFTTGEGRYGDPLTGADGDRRLLRGCQARSSPRVQEATPVFTRLCTAVGLPQRIRPDKGVPLATHALAHLAPLSAWWVRLGILPECIASGQPQPNRRHERMHRPLNAETTRPPAAPRRAPQHTCDRFRHACNCERLHDALDMPTPASCDEVSPRARPPQLPPLASPDRFEVRDVRANGGIRWHPQGVTVSRVCVGASVGLEAMDDGSWKVSCGPLTRGRRLERHLHSEDADGRLTRHRCL